MNKRWCEYGKVGVCGEGTEEFWRCETDGYFDHEWSWRVYLEEWRHPPPQWDQRRPQPGPDAENRGSRATADTSTCQQYKASMAIVHCWHSRLLIRWWLQRYLWSLYISAFCAVNLWVYWQSDNCICNLIQCLSDWFIKQQFTIKRTKCLDASSLTPLHRSHTNHQLFWVKNPLNNPRDGSVFPDEAAIWATCRVPQFWHLLCDENTIFGEGATIQLGTFLEALMSKCCCCLSVCLSSWKMLANCYLTAT